jgi:hypothetical protein
MSTASNSAFPPLPPTSDTISSSGPLRRPQPTTVAPSLASSTALARPSPVPAPEIAQIFPSSSPGAKIRELEDSAMPDEHMSRKPPNAVRARDYAPACERESGGNPA